MSKRLIAFLSILSLFVFLPSIPVNAADRKFQAEGCHAKVSATLQKKDGSAWKDVVAAQGWEAVASCPATNPYAPWAKANISIGTTIRWHIYASGAWDFYTTESQVEEVFDPKSFAPVTTQADIKTSDYPYVAALARASIFADQPLVPTSQKITYQFENGVPIENQNMIKEGSDNFLSHFGNILSYSSKAINIIVYKTNAGASDLAKVFDSSDSYFLKDLADTVERQGDRDKVLRMGMGGFSMGYKRVIVIGSSYFYASDPNLPTYPSDPVVAPHELTHELQASINKGVNMRNPVWLCEGGAQVVGAAMSVYQSKEFWAGGGREQWSERIPAGRTIADLKMMEGEDPNGSEYTTGAALSEYLIAWGGFSNSLLVNQISYKLHNPDTMSAFRQAFKLVYGQSLDDFYTQALPYINYVAANPKMSDSTNAQATSFITERLGSIKVAATKTTVTKAVATKMTTVSCVKGKQTKKVTAVKPVCPTGYKKK
jgi:hypothetical protein